jgi:hypothetical protein
MIPRFKFVALAVHPGLEKSFGASIKTNLLSVNIEKPLMRQLSLCRFSLLAVAIFTLFSCNKKEVYDTDKLSDYIPLTPGKYITYRLDSMVFRVFGTVTEIHKYQVKHVIDAQIPDNLGRPSYRVFVYIRDSAGLQPWQPSGNTYFITPLEDRVEVVENNLRFIKIHAPVKDGYSWKGNSFLPSVVKGPYDPFFSFNNDDNMYDWDYYYDGNPSSFSYQGFNYTNVQTVEEADESTNVPIILDAYAYRSRAVEKYSKNIGLVYREYELWDYQTNLTPHYKTGFGITMWMIDHN